MTKPTKSQIVTEIEKHLRDGEATYKPEHITAFIIDVMNQVRKLPTAALSTFNGFLEKFDEAVNMYRCKGRSDFVFDMYSERPSVKDMEQVRRTADTPIVLSSINESTPFPKDPSRFWTSKHNKLELEKLIYTHLRTKPISSYPTVLSTLVSNDEA